MMARKTQGTAIAFLLVESPFYIRLVHKFDTLVAVAIEFLICCNSWSSRL